MSDPVSSMDVEDVLSSIRRLVSEEAKSTGNTSESVAEIASNDLHEAAETAAAGPLSEIVQAMEDDVTDDEDVSPSCVPPSNEVEDDLDGLASGENGEVSFRHKSSISLRQTKDQKLVLTAAFRVSEPDASGEDTQNEAPEVAANTSKIYPHLRPVADLQDVVETDVNVPNENLSDALAAKDAGDSDHVSAVIRPKKVISPSRFEVAPEDTLFDRAKHAMEAVRQTNDLRRPTAVDDDDEVAQDAPIEILTTLDEDQSETGSGKLFGVSIGASIGSEQVAEEAETEDETEEEAVSATSPFSRLGESFGGATTDTEVEADEEEPSTINFAEEDASVLDEDTLRDLVSDMVREELQGELGDRITRNVRKLVRREIQRALASREFE
ncbi:MAG: hypothetical protein ACI8YI_002049 [Paracoccaceae bacterium]|jgi:hypothetical protein